MKYALVLSYKDPITGYLFNDLEDSSDIDIIYIDVPCKSNIKNITRKIYTSLKINKVISLPNRQAFYNDICSVISGYDCAIFNNVCAAKIGVRGLERIRQSNVKEVLVLLDSLEAHSESLINSWRIIKNYNWNRILSYDKSDCIKRGFTYIGLCYYSKLNDIVPSHNNSDLYYIGTDKKEDGRSELLKNIARFSRDNEIETNFTILNRTTAFRHRNLDGINYINIPVPYTKVLSDVLSTNCILELLQDGQMMQSIRYFEAVCYNKKLLTNNSNIVNLPFYNPKYMRVFSSMDDIDIDWVRKKEDINYQYNGEFSPMHLTEIFNTSLQMQIVEKSKE